LFAKIKNLFKSSKKDAPAPQIDPSNAAKQSPPQNPKTPPPAADYSRKDGLRSPAEIMDRVQCLLALVSRAQYENELQRDGVQVDQIKATIATMQNWFKEQGLINTFSAKERALVLMDGGTWQQNDVLQSHWRTESMATLLWALGKLQEMPPFGIRIVPKIYKTGLPQGASDEDWGKDVQPRNREQVVRMRELANLWHWRSRTRLMQLQGMSPPQGETYGQTVARAVDYARQQGLIMEPGGDLTVKGITFTKLDQQAFGEAFSSSLERHYALNWLLDGVAWDDVQTDT
jgi:hypothetical protein